jgi:hypothetical protein
VDLGRKSWRNHQLDKPTDKTQNQPPKRESDQKTADTKHPSKAKRQSAGNHWRNQNCGGANSGGNSANKPLICYNICAQTPHQTPLIAALENFK